MSPETLTRPTSSTPIASSTSTTAVARRHQVRPKRPTLTAVPCVTTTPVVLPDGTALDAVPGQWLITNGAQIVDVLSPDQFTRLYEPVEATGLVLAGALRARIERTLGIGSTETPEHLVTAIERTARLVIGDVRVDFTPGQWEHLAHRAEKMGITVDQLLTRVVARITDDLWNQA